MVRVAVLIYIGFAKLTWVGAECSVDGIVVFYSDVRQTVSWCGFNGCWFDFLYSLSVFCVDVLEEVCC